MAVTPIPYFNDNYAYLVSTEETNILFDAGDGTAIADFVESRGIVPDLLFLTHNHRDHDGGVGKLQKRFPEMAVVSPSDAQDYNFPAVDGITVKPIHTPGHTMEHVCYFIPEEKAVITGDTLFAGGCGRCFTKKFALYCESLRKLALLPEDTRTFGAHEYLRDNVVFLRVIGEDVSFYEARLQTEQFPAVGITIGEELQFNPFLRLTGKRECAKFTELRKQKDSF